MQRRASIALVASCVSAVLAGAGCYSSHLRPADAGPIDAEVRRDGGMDAGRDAGPITCCTEWRFERRVLVEGFGDEQTVTPRLIELEHAPAVVVTGPSDSIGPSGAHLVRFSPDLEAQTAPVAVTSGSFTWGQPASSGDRFAVCWGTGGGRNVARLYDADGVPVSEIIPFVESVRSPCIDAAHTGGRFVFVFTASTGSSSFLIPRALDAATSTIVEYSIGLGVETDSPSASIVGMDDGFMFAVGDSDPANIFAINRDGSLYTGSGTGRAGPVQIVRGRDAVELLWEFDDGWFSESLDLSTLTRLGAARLLQRFEPSTSPTFDATSDACGTPMLGTSTPSLMRVEPSGLVEFMPDAPSPGTLAGDTSVLVLGTDAYVAFSANSPSLNPQVHVDHYVCNAE